MMKKHYIKPAILLFELSNTAIICLSGVDGTSNFCENVTTETTDVALARHQDLWNDE